ncbi:DUF3152 domain-containing protein [Streptomyces sp. NPDC002992]|uniref:DUF3152 domain-containing protein n=1 Tax=Streptomyces sp. NPDC002992 TaxID=3154273 RepID=UPI0033BF55C0
MGRHSRKGHAPAPPADPGQREAAEPGTGRRRRAPGQDSPDEYAEGAYGQRSPYGQSGYGRQGGAGPRHGAGPRQGAGQTGYTQGPGALGGYGQGAGGQGSGAQGAYGQGPSAQGGYGQGSTQDGGRPVWDTPMHGTPMYTAPAEASVRGGHPEHAEAPRRPQGHGERQGAGARGPAQEETAAQAPYIPGQRRETVPDELPEEPPARAGGKGRTLTGIAAAAVTTVLAVVVAGQVAERDSGSPLAHAAEGSADRSVEDGGASRSDSRPTPALPAPAVPVAPPTYEQLMTRQFPIDPKLTGSGEFEAVAGFEKAPGKGRKVRYRVDVEKGLGLDAALFAQAVQKTLNDPRSWAGRGAMTFERISSGEPEFVITLASPGTTGAWCAKSGLDTTIDNVSCDSASTSRVMINAFRWAQGSETFGDKAMFAYRQMLINHEVGHRLGHSHVICRTPGALAPVMQQQTKSLEVDGIKCRPNPWVHPGS